MSHYIYYIAFFILSAGLYIIIVSDNYIKKILGLGLFQTSVIIFYIGLGFVKSGAVPIAQIKINNILYVSPLPQVLMLTAIVVGFATLSLSLALIYQIYINYKTLSASDLKKIISANEMISRL